MIVVNKDKLKAEHRNAEYEEGLEEFLTKVAMLKPLAKFAITDKCVTSKRYKEGDEIKHKTVVYLIRAYENGERLGTIGRSTRWRNGKEEAVYMVEGFRVNKQRGSRNMTTTADMKKAISVVKKTFVPRQDEELRELVKNQVSHQVNSLASSYGNSLRWDFSQESELLFYAMQAYHARMSGDANATMPAKPTSIRDINKHDKNCEQYNATKTLDEMVKAKMGYGVKAMTDSSLVVYDFANDTVHKYESFDDLPMDIQQKYAMFKVLEKGEAILNIGCKLNEGFAFVAK